MYHSVCYKDGAGCSGLSTKVNLQKFNYTKVNKIIFAGSKWLNYICIQ